MTFVCLILENLSYVFSVVSLYFLYILYKRTNEEKENDLILSLVLYSILYIEFKCGTILNYGLPAILINIPLVIAMLKRKKIHVLAISIFLIIYYYSFYKMFLPLIILEYLIYFIIYLKNKNIYYSLLGITIIKLILSVGYLYYNEYEMTFFALSILNSVIFYISSVFVVWIFNKYEELLKMFLSVKELNQNKQIQNSLFKISHEIKNPIAVCKGYLDMFDINNEKHAKKYIPILKEEIDRSLIILEDFLSMNKLKINKDILDINMLLEESMNNYRHIFRKNNIDVKVDLIDDELYVNGDYNRLMQVIINIFKNSLEAKDVTKKMKFEISQEIKDGKIIINFLDNGVGISKENLKKIKEPFFTTKIGGTGLGTSLSTEIIEAHNGTIDFYSEEGEYTLVTIAIPLTNF